LSAAAAIALFLEPANALILYDESDSASAHFWDDVRSLGRLDPCATEPEPSSIDNAPYVFLRQGDIWTLRFTTESGVEQNPFTNSPGFVMYHTLLENPGKRMEALDVDPHTRPVEESGLPMADKKAIAQTLQRKKELEDQQAIAEATRDHVTAAEAGHELRDIEKYLAEVSFAGRAKSARPRNARLAHTNIKTAFSRTRKRIASEGMPQLAAYLEEQVKPEAGQGWRYTPSEGVQWLTKLEEADSHDEQQSVESDTPPF
jgi:hypothetical protein